MNNKRFSMETVIHEYPSLVASETMMFSDLGRFLTQYGIEGDLAQDVKLCVSEGFNNAILHGNRLDASKNVTLALTVNTEEVIADIIDEGRDGLAAIKGRKTPTCQDEVGRGINLMYERADDVQLSSADDRGLTLRLVFSRIKTRINNTQDLGASPLDGCAPQVREES